MAVRGEISEYNLGTGLTGQPMGNNLMQLKGQKKDGTNDNPKSKTLQICGENYFSDSILTLSLKDFSNIVKIIHQSKFNCPVSYM